jgi:seryl-tRNA synthetase
MIATAQEYYKSLGIPNRTVSIVAGALNDAAAKKYDLEGWFPGYGTFRELVSCSNCTDFQSRALEIKHGTKLQGAQESDNLTHMLNSTLAATTRTMCCILENFQTPEGVALPEVLRPYFGGKDFLKYDQKCVDEYLAEKEKNDKIEADKAEKEA